MQVIDSGVRSAVDNMDYDKKLLENLREEPVLHLYDWQKPSFTYGHFVKVDEYVDIEACHKLGIESAKRPTGGGVILHTHDLAFSFLFPSSHPLYTNETLESYRRVNQIVIEAASLFNPNFKECRLLDFSPEAKDTHSERFCMAHPTRYDLILHGQKLAGAAQRRTKQGLLHQGSILIQKPPQTLLEALFPSPIVRKGMQTLSKALIEDPSKNALIEARAQLKECLKKAFLQIFE